MPKLPVPDLKLTLQKYLRCVMPIVSEDAYKKTEVIVNKFSEPGGIGEQLQKILLDEAQTKDNWVILYFCKFVHVINDNLKHNKTLGI